MDDLEEDLTCSVCYALFCDPRVLPCSHTFCKACLDSVLQASLNNYLWRPRLLKCPNCRSVVELCPTGVEALPVNVSLRAIVEKYQRDRHPQPPCCPDHQRQPLNVYCVQDRKLICGLCLTVGQHQGHTIDDLHAAFIRERGTPAQLLVTLSEQRWEQVCELAETLEKGKAHCEGLVRKDRLAVDQFFLGLELTLRKKKEACLAALDSASADIANVYDPLIHRVGDMQMEQLELSTLVSSLEAEDRPLEFLDQVHLLRERSEALMDAPLPSPVTLSISPHAADYLRHHWTDVTLGRLDQAPVPRLCCCVGCDQQGGGREARSGATKPAGSKGRVPRIVWPLPPRAMFIGLTLVLASFWIHLVGPEQVHAELRQWVDQISELRNPVVEVAAEVNKQFKTMEGYLRVVVGDLFMQLGTFVNTHVWF